MEVNARSWKWNSLATACGVNLPYVAYLDITGRGKKELNNQIYGKKWILYITDLYYSLRGYRLKGYSKHKLSFRRWLRSIKGEKVEGIFSIKDPLPGFMYIVSLITSGCSKIIRTFFTKKN
jgi:predicted ATP-grasp superfamily ATP-dependent carboligase